jgi:hypothetical protein
VTGSLPGEIVAGIELAADADAVYAAYQDVSVGAKLTVAKLANGAVTTVGTQGLTTVGQLIPALHVVNGVPTLVVAGGIVSVVTGVNKGHLFVLQPE